MNLVESSGCISGFRKRRVFSCLCLSLQTSSLLSSSSSRSIFIFRWPSVSLLVLPVVLPNLLFLHRSANLNIYSLLFVIEVISCSTFLFFMSFVCVQILHLSFLAVSNAFFYFFLVSKLL